MQIGYRSWEVVEVNGKPRLKSPHAPGSRFYWEPRETVALCTSCAEKARIHSSKFGKAEEKVFGDLEIIQSIDPTILKKILSTIRSEIKADPQDYMGECTCGLYALRSPETCIERGYTNGILGQIALYGRVVLGESGFRAEKARVLSFIVPSFRYINPDLLYSLAEEYQASIIKAEYPLYDMICKIRGKSMPHLMKSIHHKNAPLDNRGKEYWGEKDTSYDFLTTGLNNQLDTSIRVPAQLTTMPRVSSTPAQNQNSNHNHISSLKVKHSPKNASQAQKSSQTDKPQEEPKLDFSSLRDRISKLKKKE